ncbi:MAG: hypothetical protein M3680_16680 [Myxococcota bacterium]|nr:hypothetical protein [Myxococcota bacterium]
MHKQRIWIAAICGVGLLTAFMPWVTMMGIVGVTGMDFGQGWVVLALFGAALAVALTGARAYALDGARRGILGVIGAAAVGFAVWKMIEIQNGKLDLGGELGRQMGRAGGEAGVGSGDGMENLGREMGRGMMSMFGEMFEVSFGIYAMILAGLALVIAAVLKRRAA